MNVIVRSQDALYSLVVDEILDVMSVDKSSFTLKPDMLDKTVSKYIDGVYKLKDKLLILLSLETLVNIESNGD